MAVRRVSKKDIRRIAKATGGIAAAAAAAATAAAAAEAATAGVSEARGAASVVCIGVFCRLNELTLFCESK